MGGQRSRVPNQPPLPMSLPAIPWPPSAAEDEGPSSWAAPRAHSTVPRESLFHQLLPAVSGTEVSDGDLILPKLGQNNLKRWDGSLQVMAEEWLLWQSLQPLTGSAGACRRGCKGMPCPLEISASDALWEGKTSASQASGDRARRESSCCAYAHWHVQRL